MIFLGPQDNVRTKQNQQKQKQKKKNAGLVRLNQEMTDLDLPKHVAKIDFCNKKDLSCFNVIITPSEETYWYKGKYTFSFKISPDYPHVPPKVMCITKVGFSVFGRYFCRCFIQISILKAMYV